MKRERGSTIARVLDILDVVASSPAPISASELGETLNAPNTTVHRLCADLEIHGYLLKRVEEELCSR